MRLRIGLFQNTFPFLALVEPAPNILCGPSVKVLVRVLPIAPGGRHFDDPLVNIVAQGHQQLDHVLGLGFPRNCGQEDHQAIRRNGWYLARQAKMHILEVRNSAYSGDQTMAIWNGQTVLVR